MQGNENIIIKGKKEGLEILLPAKCNFSEVFDELKSKLDENKSFFEGLNNVNVVYSALTPQNMMEIKTLFQERLEDAKVSFTDKTKKDLKKDTVSNTKSLYLKETIRSGQKIEFEGNIIVLGDVNAGAELIAAGDILIMGTFRGLAHAGALGDEKSVVTAIKLQPVQIRIANLIAVSPEKYLKSEYPEIARAKNGIITIEPLDK